LPNFPEAADERAQSDEVAIRVVFNRWCGPVQFPDHAARTRELADRERTLTALYRLYAISRRHTANHDTRNIRAGDVERVITSFRRLALMWGLQPKEIADYCERAAVRDTNTLAHLGDPFQLRHILTFHKEPLNAQLTETELLRLRAAVLAQDRHALRAWFAALAPKRAQLPRDTSQRLRAMLLELWNAHLGDLETLAYELTVLDVQLCDTMGWENMRMFCALLKRIGGSAHSAFGAYLNDEDIDEALQMHQSLGHADQVAHFRGLLSVYDTKLIRDLERAVFSSAKYADVVVPADPGAPARGKRTLQTRLLSFFGLANQARSAA
jgi:hypothetical protein